MPNDEPQTWEDALRIIQAAPCNELQLQRIGEVAQIDTDTRFLELASSLTLTGECVGKKFGCAVEVMEASAFFALPQKPKGPPPAGAAGMENGDALAIEFSADTSSTRFDCIQWSLDIPLSGQELVGACQRIRSSLNVNGCLFIALPVRLGVRPSEDAASFYQSICQAPLMMPRDVASALEESGFETLAVEFAHNRQALARYRMIESALEKFSDVGAAVKERWKKETRLFLKEGGVSFFPSAVFVARRWEYVDGT